MPRAFQSPARDSKERARDTRRCIGSCLSKMSRAVLLCCTTLALLFSVGAAHAQQGNLPTPVQKLPAYPPVACVTPDWTSEPCANRTPSEEANGWKAFYELLKFFGSWPAWTRGADFPTRPPKFVWPQQEECPKDPHPFGRVPYNPTAKTNWLVPLYAPCTSSSLSKPRISSITG
jgi:hypothetical protein